MVGADVLLQFTFSSAKFYFQHAGSLLSAYCILSASLHPMSEAPWLCCPSSPGIKPGEEEGFPSCGAPTPCHDWLKITLGFTAAKAYRRSGQDRFEWVCPFLGHSAVYSP